MVIFLKFCLLHLQTTARRWTVTMQSSVGVEQERAQSWPLMTNTFVVEDPFSTGLDPVLIRQPPMISEAIEVGSRGLQAKGAGKSFYACRGDSVRALGPCRQTLVHVQIRALSLFLQQFS